MKKAIEQEHGLPMPSRKGDFRLAIMVMLTFLNIAGTHVPVIVFIICHFAGLVSVMLYILLCYSCQWQQELLLLPLYNGAWFHHCGQSGHSVSLSSRSIPRISIGCAEVLMFWKWNNCLIWTAYHENVFGTYYYLETCLCPCSSLVRSVHIRLH